MFVIVLLSSCGIINKSASSFNSRKYTPGIFWNGAGRNQSIVSNNTEKQSAIYNPERIEHQNGIVANTPEVIPEIRGEKTQQFVPLVILNKKQSKQSVSLIITKERVGAACTYNDSSYQVASNPGKRKGAVVGFILACLIALLLLAGTVLLFIGIISFFVIVLAGFAAWALILLCLLAYFISAILLATLGVLIMGDRTEKSTIYK